MKELDELKSRCIQAMKDVDSFVEGHYDELLTEIREQYSIPHDWEMRIISNCGVVTGCFRPSIEDEWRIVVYNDGAWKYLHDACLSMCMCAKTERNTSTIF